MLETGSQHEPCLHDVVGPDLMAQVHDARFGRGAQQGAFHLAHIGVEMAEIREQGDNGKHATSCIAKPRTCPAGA
jgi:hypothetical protein